MEWHLTFWLDGASSINSSTISTTNATLKPRKDLQPAKNQAGVELSGRFTFSDKRSERRTVPRRLESSTFVIQAAQAASRPNLISIQIQIRCNRHCKVAQFQNPEFRRVATGSVTISAGLSSTPSNPTFNVETEHSISMHAGTTSCEIDPR